MIKVKKDLTNMTFGRLTVLRQTDDFIGLDGQRRPMWLCECSCGNPELINVRGDSLTSGHTRSCGCLQSENAYEVGKLNQEYNKRDLSGEYGVLWASNTNEEIYFDLDDADVVLKYNWYISENGYPVASINRKTTAMHSLLGCKNYDHHNRNKLDNRRENLMKCTVQENARNGSIRTNNTSGFIGVSQRKDTKKWAAGITIDARKIHLGYFTNKYDAIKTRLKAEAEYFGEFAPQRHLFEEYGVQYPLNDLKILDNTKLM